MQYLKTLNEIIKYIDDNLKENIDIKEFIHDTSFSYDMISRLFSTLTDITLVKYIRARRLSEAAKEISIYKKRVVDIAFDYGYDSADSFGYAFKKYHGVTPTEVRNGSNYMYLLPLRFRSSIEGGRDIIVEVEDIDVFTISAYKIEIPTEKIVKESLFSDIWHNFKDKLKKVTDVNKINLYEIYDFDDDGTRAYYVGCDKLSDKQSEKIKFKSLDIPKSKYAVFSVKASEVRKISEPFKYIRRTFFSGPDDINKSAPDFIFYSTGSRDDFGYEVKVYIAIKGNN